MCIELVRYQFVKIVCQILVRENESIHEVFDFLLEIREVIKSRFSYEIDRSLHKPC
jgi:hypothetical protein